MYSCDEKYLYEILEDYSEALDQVEKDEIFSSFCDTIWNCGNTRRTYPKEIKFFVQEDLLHTEIGQIFNTWSVIEYNGCRFRTTNTQFNFLIRQKINNIYTLMFDPTVILNKDYMDILKTPKKLYFRWLHGEQMNPQELTEKLDNIYHEATILKGKYAKRKMTLDWSNYKILITKYLRQCFENCKLLDGYDTWTKTKSNTDTWIDDNVYVRYFCRSLSGYIRNYQKEYAGLTRGRNKKYDYCIDCEKLYEKRTFNQKRCPICQAKYNRINKTLKQRKYRVEKQKV